MKIGAMIANSPQNWQIIQQVGGYGKIAMDGIWATAEPENDLPEVYVRIVREDLWKIMVRIEAW